MTLVHILVFIPLAFLAGKIRSSRHRVLFLLATSLAAVYWLQPALPVRNMDFWLPTLSIALVVLTWASTHPAGSKENGQKPQPAAGDAANRGGGRPPLLSRLVSRPNLLAILLIASVLLAIALTRYTGSLCCLTATRPPAVWQVLLVAGVVILLGTLFVRLVKNRQILTTAIITLILAFFIVLKSPFLIERASAWLRTLTGQPVELATATDLAWLGFSFLAFRLIHVLRDFQTGKLPRYSLADVTSYALFFPAYTAGPIDRSQRWISESQKQAAPSSADLIDGAWRIFSGLFKKFVLADSLALIALSSQNATQMQSALWAWIILYAYALRIYLDFSGYTDIAIGLGRLAGFRLPENFAAPLSQDQPDRLLELLAHHPGAVVPRLFLQPPDTLAALPSLKTLQYARLGHHPARAAHHHAADRAVARDHPQLRHLGAMARDRALPTQPLVGVDAPALREDQQQPQLRSAGKCRRLAFNLQLRHPGLGVVRAAHA
jgi:alginate O-acetyltransferase complex protein AlgI